MAIFMFPHTPPFTCPGGPPTNSSQAPVSRIVLWLDLRPKDQVREKCLSSSLLRGGPVGGHFISILVLLYFQFAFYRQVPVFTRPILSVFFTPKSNTLIFTVKMTSCWSPFTTPTLGTNMKSLCCEYECPHPLTPNLATFVHFYVKYTVHSLYIVLTPLVYSQQG